MFVFLLFFSLLFPFYVLVGVAVVESYLLRGGRRIGDARVRLLFLKGCSFKRDRKSR